MNLKPNNFMNVKSTLKRIEFIDLFIINTSFFNIAITATIYLLLRYLPQANHLVFGQFEPKDLIMPSVLISIYTIYIITIYFENDNEVSDETTNSQTNIDLTSSTPLKQISFFGLINRILFSLPFLIWSLTLFFNGDLSSQPFWPFTLAILFMFLFAAGPGLLLWKKIVKTGFEDQFKQNAKIIKNSVYILTISFLIKCYKSYGDFQEPQITWFLILSLILIIYILVTRFKEPMLKLFNLTYWQDHKVIMFTIILMIVLAALLWMDLRINGLTIIIFYFLFIRILIHLTGEFILIEKSILSIWKHLLQLLAIMLVGVVLIFVITKRYKRDYLKFEAFNRVSERATFKDYVINWLENGDKVSPIYLVAGQGGGSRAGAAFYTSVSLLDTVFKNNLLAITTASGSSNGAGFYLALKESITKSTKDSKLNLSNVKDVRLMDSILYNRDFISSSLFKVLFSDYARLMIGSKKANRSRNSTLMKEETEAFYDLTHHFHLDSVKVLDTTWSAFYNDKTYLKPLFFPNTYNIEKGVKAISSPVILPADKMAPFFDLLGSIENNDLLIRQSINLSQMFPVISASAQVGKYHYLDGGVYDNLSYETLFNLYNLVKEIRDSFRIKRPIILISIVNSDYMSQLTFEDVHTELNATSSAAIQSLFGSNPFTHKQLGLSKLCSKDLFFELNVFTSSNNPSSKKKNPFRYDPDNSKVLLSRYLNMNNIDTILVNSIKGVDSFKIALTHHLARSFSDTSICKVK
jgi:hypothetical protein